MPRSRTTFLAALAITTAGACKSADPAGPADPATRPGDPVVAAMQAAPAVPNIAGEWIFRERIWTLQPSELNAVIGAPAVDRPMTQVVCHALGTLSLEQAGPTFQGTATQAVVCNVDGIEFVPPDFAFNPVFEVFNGQIRGHSIQFETGHTLNVCINRGSGAVVNGDFETMRIVSSCPVPFHPGEAHSRWSIQRVPASP